MKALIMPQISIPYDLVYNLGWVFTEHPQERKHQFHRISLIYSRSYDKLVIRFMRVNGGVGKSTYRA